MRRKASLRAVFLKKQIIKHPNAEALNYMLSEFIIILEQKEIELWKNGFEITLERLKEEMSTSEGMSFQQYVYDTFGTSELVLNELERVSK